MSARRTGWTQRPPCSALQRECRLSHADTVLYAVQLVPNRWSPLYITQRRLKVRRSPLLLDELQRSEPDAASVAASLRTSLDWREFAAYTFRRGRSGTKSPIANTYPVWCLRGARLCPPSTAGWVAASSLLWWILVHRSKTAWRVRGVRPSENDVRGDGSYVAVGSGHES